MADAVRPDETERDESAHDDAAGSRVRLNLIVDDPETVAELLRYSDPEERKAYALRALKIGVLALRQGGNRVPA